MTAKLKDEANRTALAADDLMAAACMNKDSLGGSRVGAAPKIKDMRIEKVKHSGKSLEQRTKVEGLLTDIKDCLDTAYHRLETLKGRSEAVDETFNELLQDLKDSHNDARVHLEATQSRLKELENLFRSATTENFNDLQADLGNQIKEMTKGAYKSFRAKALKLNQTITKLERGMKVQNEGRKEGEDVVRAPSGHPLFAIMQTICDDMGEEAKAAGSLFEAKGGMRAALVPPKRGQDPATELQKNAYIKSGLKQLGTVVATSSKWAVWSMREAPKRKKVEKILTKAFEPDLFCKLVLPKDIEWANTVFDPQLYATRSQHVSVGLTPFAVMEARLLLSGKEMVCGIPIEKVPGDTIKDKRQSLFRSTIDNIKMLIAQGGFFVAYESMRVCTIPTGFFIITASDSAQGIRWGMSSDEADSQRAALHLKALLSSFPELKNASTGHSQFLEYLLAAL
jgi:hypothetical protein